MNIEFYGYHDERNYAVEYPDDFLCYTSGILNQSTKDQSEETILHNCSHGVPC